MVKKKKKRRYQVAVQELVDVTAKNPSEAKKKAKKKIALKRMRWQYA